MWHRLLKSFLVDYRNKVTKHSIYHTQTGELAMQGAKASATMLLTHCSRIIPVSAPEGLNIQ